MGIKSGFLQPVQEKPANTQASANLLSLMMIKIIYFIIYIKKIYYTTTIETNLVYVHNNKDIRKQQY